MIWGHRIEDKNFKKQLNRLNRLACTEATMIERTTPQASLELIFNIIPLDLHIKEQAMQAFARIKSQLDKPWSAYKPKIKPHLRHWKIECAGIETQDDRYETTI